MKIFRTWNNSIDSKQLAEIVHRLEEGEVMIYPTDTMYAVGCDALNVKALDRLCRLQGINPEKSHLSIICHDLSQASEYARIENGAFKLMKSHLPGPYTFIHKAGSNLPRAFKGRKQVGVRIPACEAPRQIVEYLGHPICSSSIKFEDEDYAVNPELIMENHEGKVDFMIVGMDGGTVPSTIVDCCGDEPVLIREGLGEF